MPREGLLSQSAACSERRRCTRQVDLIRACGSAAAASGNCQQRQANAAAIRLDRGVVLAVLLPATPKRSPFQGAVAGSERWPGCDSKAQAQQVGSVAAQRLPAELIELDDALRPICCRNCCNIDSRRGPTAPAAP